MSIVDRLDALYRETGSEHWAQVGKLVCDGSGTAILRGSDSSEFARGYTEHICAWVVEFNNAWPEIRDRLMELDARDKAKQQANASMPVTNGVFAPATGSKEIDAMLLMKQALKGLSAAEQDRAVIWLSQYVVGEA